jgi:hypothetical protein
MFHTSPCVNDTHVFLPTGYTVPGKEFKSKKAFPQVPERIQIFEVTPFGEKRRCADFWPFVFACTVPT